MNLQVATRFSWLVWRKGRISALLAMVVTAIAWVLERGLAVHTYQIPLNMLFIYCLVGLCGSLGFDETGDIGGLESSYPRFLFLMPVSTWTLVLWPMLLGSLMISTVWAVFAWVMLVPQFGLAIMGWPAMGLVAMLTGSQAISWSPMPVPYVRVALICVVSGGLFAGGTLAFTGGISPVHIALSYGFFAVLAVFTAANRLQIGRTGSCLVRNLGFRARRSKTVDLPAFRSPQAAHLWLEASRNGFLIPGLTAVIIPITFWPLYHVSEWSPITMGGCRFDKSLFIPALSVLWPFLLAGLDGCCSSFTDNFKRDFSLQPFLATRPLSDAALVEVKFRAAALSVVRAYALILLPLAVVLCSPVEVQGHHTTVGQVLMQHASLRGLMLGALAVFFVMGGAWKGTVSALWLRLVPNRWIANLLGIGLPSAMSLATVLFLTRAYADPSLLNLIIRWAPTAIIALVCVKLVVLVVVVTRVRVSGLIPDPVLVRWGAICLAIGVWVFAGLSFALAVDKVLLAAGIVLILPLVRVQLAVLSMHAARHR